MSAMLTIENQVQAALNQFNYQKLTHIVNQALTDKFIDVIVIKHKVIQRLVEPLREIDPGGNNDFYRIRYILECLVNIVDISQQCCDQLAECDSIDPLLRCFALSSFDLGDMAAQIMGKAMKNHEEYRNAALDNGLPSMMGMKITVYLVDMTENIKHLEMVSWLLWRMLDFDSELEMINIQFLVTEVIGPLLELERYDTIQNPLLEMKNDTIQDPLSKTKNDTIQENLIMALKCLFRPKNRENAFAITNETHMLTPIHTSTTCLKYVFWDLPNKSSSLMCMCLELLSEITDDVDPGLLDDLLETWPICDILYPILNKSTVLTSLDVKFLRPIFLICYNISFSNEGCKQLMGSKLFDILFGFVDKGIPVCENGPDHPVLMYSMDYAIENGPDHRGLMYSMDQCCVLSSEQLCLLIDGFARSVMKEYTEKKSTTHISLLIIQSNFEADVIRFNDSRNIILDAMYTIVCSYYTIDEPVLMKKFLVKYSFVYKLCNLLNIYQYPKYIEKEYLQKSLELILSSLFRLSAMYHVRIYRIDNCESIIRAHGLKSVCFVCI